MKNKKDITITANNLRVNYTLKLFFTNKSLVTLFNNYHFEQTVFGLNDYGLRKLIKGLKEIGIEVDKVYENYTRSEPIDITKNFKRGASA